MIWGERGLIVRRLIAGTLIAMSLMALLTGCGPSPARLDLSGHWEGQVVGKQGDEFSGISYQFDLYLTQEGNSLTGSITMGNALFAISVPITHGVVDQLDKSVVIDAEGEVSLFGTTKNVSFHLTGSASNTEMSGDCLYEIEDEVHNFTWQVYRKR